MAMRKPATRRGAAASVSAELFGWPPSLIATARHSTLPWHPAGDEDAVDAAPLTTINRVGERDSLSLVGQLAGYLAFARFAGIPTSAFDSGDWGIVQKRGRDVRLVRLASPSRSSSEVLAITLLESLATRLGAPPLESLRQSWAKPEAIYVEIRMRLRATAADRSWFSRAAVGSIEAPGADCLDRLAARPSVVVCDDPSASSTLLKFSSLRKDAEPRLVVLDGSRGSPLQPMSAIGALVPLRAAHESESVAAEAAIATLREHHAIIVVASWDAFDPASKRVVRLLLDSGEALSWLIPSALCDAASLSDEPLAAASARRFIVASRTRDLAALTERLASLAPAEACDALDALAGDDEAYGAFLDEGVLPEVSGSTAFSRLAEPARSYLAALALLGSAPPIASAEALLERIGASPEIEALVRDDICTIDRGRLRFASEKVRRRLVTLLPEGSRAPLSRIAAEISTGDPLRHAALLVEAEAPDAANLEGFSLDDGGAERVVDELGEFEPAKLARCPGACALLAEALIRAGRYRDARRFANAAAPPAGLIARARIERRLGDYGAALSHLEAVTQPRFDASLLAAELHRLRGQLEHASRELQRCEGLAASPSQKAALAYELAILALDRGVPSTNGDAIADPYLAARHASYLDEASANLADAATHAREAARAATSVPDRIDAELDLVYALFLSGDWKSARHQAREALLIVEETQGDRAAAGILFTLAFLCADSAQWPQARQKIDRLRRFYQEREDDRRARELDLLTAQLAMGQLQLETAERLAAPLLDEPISPEMREAVAIILDEVAWVGGTLSSPRSSGESQCVELTDRHLLAVARTSRADPHGFRRHFIRELARWEIERLHGRTHAPPECREASDQLLLLRSCVALRRRNAGEGLDQAIDDLSRELVVDQAALAAPRAGEASSRELDILRRAAIEEFPFAAGALSGARWRFATRNRIGRWTEIGSINPPLEASELDAIAERQPADWVVAGAGRLLHLEELASWSVDSRRALAALFQNRAELANLRRLVAADRDATMRTGETAVSGIVGSSNAIRATLALISPAASRDVPVCIEGESGTGKELIARAIHDRSPRRGRVFTAINCAALPENLVESELFGCVRGAFTGADRDREGLIEATNGGTLFLDEIGEMAPQAQAKLLRFLQEREFRRVGETVNRRADVRVIAATNRRLEESVDSGTFRDDLYYRIRGIEIAVPPLRERGDDILTLANHFLAREREMHGGGAERLAEDVEDMLLSYVWPGNVRELQNTMRAAHALAGESAVITTDHLPARLRDSPARRPKRGTLNDELNRFRRDLIDRTLAETGGNQSRAARELGLSRQALAYQIRELGILVKRG